MQHEPLKMPLIDFPVELWYIVGVVVAAGTLKLLLKIALPARSAVKLRRRRCRRAR